jgi:hypothetical protein
LSDIIVLNITPTVVGGLVRLAITLVTLYYATRIPLKRDYHYAFVAFLAAVALWSSLAIYGQGADSVEAYTERTTWTFLVALPIQGALICNMILLFVNLKISQLQKFTLIALYSYVIIIDGILLLYPSALITRGRSTPLGYVAGAGSLTPARALYFTRPNSVMSVAEVSQPIV